MPGLGEIIVSTPTLQPTIISANMTDHPEGFDPMSAHATMVQRSPVFRVTTSNDFRTASRGIATSEGRASGNACRRCRARKIKCRVANSPGDRVCQACKQSSLACSWDTTDGRRRRRPRAEREQGSRVSQQIEMEPETSLQSVALPELEQDALFEVTDFGQSGLLNCDMSLWQVGGYADGQVAADDFILDLDNFGLPGDQDAVADDSSTRRLQRVRLRISRRYGPTAVAPGLKRLSVAVGVSSGCKTRLSSEEHRSRDSPSNARQIPSPQHHPDTEDDCFYGLPSERIYQVLDVFFQIFGGHFPFVNRQILAGHVQSKQASKLLVSAILALTARFCPIDLVRVDSGTEEPDDLAKAAPFLTAAKEQVMPLLAVPAPDVVAGLVILAWAEFGSNGEAGLWMFSGMAIRMAQDLGLHRAEEADPDPQAAFYDRSPPSPQGVSVLSDEQSALHQQKCRLVMFWAVFNMDVYVSLLMGRPPTIRRAEIEVSLPTADDMRVLQLDTYGPAKMSHILFPESARCMLIFSEAVELLNMNSSTARPTRVAERLREIGEKVTDCCRDLDTQLRFHVGSYTAASGEGQSGLFLMLHLYLYTFAALLSERSETAQAAGQKMVQLLSVAEMIDSKGYIGNPFVAYSIFTGATALLSIGSKKDKGSREAGFLDWVQTSDVESLSRMLQEMAARFRGVEATLAAIHEAADKRGAGSPNGSAAAGSDEESCDVLEIHDLGIVNRYAIQATD